MIPEYKNKIKKINLIDCNGVHCIWILGKIPVYRFNGQKDHRNVYEIVHIIT